MIKLKKGEVNNVIVTLTEKQTLQQPHYLFVFQSRMTNEKIKFVVLAGEDISTAKSRYNMFAIDVDAYFANELEGWYRYTIYEQESDTNLDESLAVKILETGLMFLDDGTDISTTTFNNSTTYKFFNA